MQKILVVEDDAPSLILTTEVLKNYKYDVVSAVDGEQALEVAERENPDLALLDVMLPGLNGFQVANACAQCRNSATCQSSCSPFSTRTRTALGRSRRELMAFDKAI